MTCLKCSQSRDGCVEPRRIVDDEGAGHCRRTVSLARHVHQSAGRLCDHVEARTSGGRTTLSETRDPDHDEARVDRVQGFPIQPHGLHRARPEVFDEDVDVGAQSLEHRGRTRRPVVDCQPALVAVVNHDVETLAIDVRSNRAAVFTNAESLDLHHLGTEVAELHPAERPRNEAGQVEHSNSIQRSAMAHEDPLIVLKFFADSIKNKIVCKAK